MAELGYVNIFARDVVKLSGFYADVFGFEEIVASRSPIFRGLKTKKASIGFNAHDAYALLNLPEATDGEGIKAFTTFDVDSAAEVDRLTPIAVAERRDAPEGAVHHLLRLVPVGPARSGRQRVPDQFCRRLAAGGGWHGRNAGGCGA